MAAKGPVVALTAEAQLKTELKAGKLRRVYYLYGEEMFLTRTYADRIAAVAGAAESDGLNYLSLRGVPDMNALSDFAESLPFFAEHKCVRITDLDAEGMDNEQMKQLTALIEQLPDTTVVIIAQTGLEIDDMKPKAKTKKLLQTAEKFGAVCRMSFLPLDKTAAMAAKKAEKSGCTLSVQDARYLSERCGRSLTLIQSEVEKLCSCKQSGEITRELIDALTPRMLDASAYDLSAQILAGRTGEALKMLDDLFIQREEPVLILAALSGAFVDSYRAKLAQSAGKTSQQAAADFGYYGGRAYFFGKTCTAVRNIPEQYFRKGLGVLYRTNLLMNSSKMDSRILLERAVTELCTGGKAPGKV